MPNFRVQAFYASILSEVYNAPAAAVGSATISLHQLGTPNTLNQGGSRGAGKAPPSP